MQQFVIREDRFIWNRNVPLYGFYVREGGDLYAGHTFVFIEVDFNKTFLTPNISQELDSCCVLRLDPTAFTVSVIVEIVEAVDIIFL